MIESTLSHCRGAITDAAHEYDRVQAKIQELDERIDAAESELEDLRTRVGEALADHELGEGDAAHDLRAALTTKTLDYDVLVATKTSLQTRALRAERALEEAELAHERERRAIAQRALPEHEQRAQAALLEFLIEREIWLRLRTHRSVALRQERAGSHPTETQFVQADMAAGLATLHKLAFDAGFELDVKMTPRTHPIPYSDEELEALENDRG